MVVGAGGGPHLCGDLPTGGAGERDVAEQEGGVLFQVSVGVLSIAAWCSVWQLVTAAFPHLRIPQFRLAPGGGGGVVKLGGGPSLVTNLNFVPPWLFTITIYRVVLSNRLLGDVFQQLSPTRIWQKKILEIL